MLILRVLTQDARGIVRKQLSTPPRARDAQEEESGWSDLLSSSGVFKSMKRVSIIFTSRLFRTVHMNLLRADDYNEAGMMNVM